MMCMWITQANKLNPWAKPFQNHAYPDVLYFMNIISGASKNVVLQCIETTHVLSASNYLNLTKCGSKTRILKSAVLSHHVTGQVGDNTVYFII